MCQNNRYIGNIEFNKKGQKIIEYNGDLLYDLFFKLKIPKFNITKNTVITQTTNTGYNINQLDVIYENNYCLIIYIEEDDKWYILPKTILLNTLKINNIIKIDSELFQDFFT